MKWETTIYVWFCVVVRISSLFFNMNLSWYWCIYSFSSLSFIDDMGKGPKYVWVLRAIEKWIDTWEAQMIDFFLHWQFPNLSMIIKVNRTLNNNKRKDRKLLFYAKRGSRFFLNLSRRKGENGVCRRWRFLGLRKSKVVKRKEENETKLYSCWNETLWFSL